MSKTRSVQYKKAILEDMFLCIDPSSGATGDSGWALFQAGRLHSSGVIHIDSDQPVEVRLREILRCLQEEFTGMGLDLLIVEKIEGRHAAAVLIQACGVFIAGIKSDHFFEMNVLTWQAIGKRLGGWKKHDRRGKLMVGADPNGAEGDEIDAQYIGWAAICFALGYDQKQKEADREESLAATRERMDGRT